MCVGINRDNWHRKILRISLQNTHGHNTCGIIGRPNDREGVICAGPQPKFRRQIAQK